ncbi:phospholipase A2 inhibitor and Ly6/PLAUR domain-containing protein-like isoform X1 [Pleurodeles waltl]|uniref:phospholipase A2 inhibitor and Ly6/PLAUR domain-containing protein-like isoform X1 n=1 Tax=Pleurodeles waltl TaxID=8319 RepID=UPI00370944DB
MYKTPRRMQTLHHPTPYSFSTMRAILAAVTMLQALINGDCLFCEQCFAVHTSSCSGIFTQCPPDVTHCVKGLENSTLGTDVILSVFKDCLSPSQKPDCGREFSFKTPTAFFRISRTCCDSDFCNAGDVQVPAVDETPNGYKCEECFIYQSTDECSPTGEVQCTGKQNTCGSLSGTILRPGEAGRQYSFKGCTTRDFCKLGIFNMAGSQAYNYRLKCSPALEP